MELTVYQALHQGVAAHNEGKLQDAERFYRTILKTQPMHPDANHNLGVIAVSLGKPKDALPLFKIATEVSPATAQFYFSYIDALIKVKQFKKVTQVIKKAKKAGCSGKDLSALNAQLTQAMQGHSKGKLVPLKAPPQAEIDNMLANYHGGQYDRARDLALSITQQFPEHTISWQVLGVLYEQAGQIEKALNAHQQAVQIDAKNAVSHNNLGNIMRGLGRFPEAELSCRQAIKLQPDFAEAHNNLGNAQQGLGRLEQAEVSYRKAMKLKPDFAGAHSNLGNVLKDLGRLEQAAASFRHAITLRPDYAEAHNNLGAVLKELDKLEQAETSCRQAITLKPNYAEAHNNLGNALNALGRIEQANASYRHALVLKPDSAEIHSNNGNVLRELGRGEEAEASYRHAIVLEPDYAKAYYDLGALLLSFRQYEEAAEYFKYSDYKQSKHYLLRCLFLLDKKSLFYEQLDYLIQRGDIHPIIGSLISRSDIRYGINKSNPFCNDPLKYVVKTNLTEQCDFKTTFIKGATDILSDVNVQHKSQGHLTNGIQTAGNVFSQGSSVTDEIQRIIRLEIEKYRVNFKDSKEGLITSWPTDYSLHGWLISMKNGGVLRPHMHEDGWISGSIYINVPAKSKRDSGNLVVCIEEEHLTGENGNQSKSIDVVTGSLCLFPASLLHYTIPFESEEERIVLAFDVKPRN
ncbi:MAG: tetratricopeptide (TPR) repeat protein [Bermanella sp.]|jgi:tetratricopeptide (TPR) repeat protein